MTDALRRVLLRHFFTAASSIRDSRTLEPLNRQASAPAAPLIRRGIDDFLRTSNAQTNRRWHNPVISCKFYE